MIVNRIIINKLLGARELGRQQVYNLETSHFLAVGTAFLSSSPSLTLCRPWPLARHTGMSRPVAK